MKWSRVIASTLVIWATTVTAWGYTLTWTANTESDLAGYRIYSCSVLNCTRTSGDAALLATLGPVTSFNFGTPATTHYYFVTAYDFSNNESAASAVVTYTPASSVPSAIGVSPTSFSFGATQGGANPAPQTLNISNTGGGTLNWHARTNASWFSLSQIDGSGNASIRVSVTTAGLLAGTYNGSITIGADGVSSFVTVPVTLTVSSATVPVIGVSPTSFSFAASQGGANPSTQTLNITNRGGGTLSWTASENVSWLTLSHSAGTGNAAVTLSVGPGSLAAGTYTGTITIAATGASSVTVPVTFTIMTGSSVPSAIGVSPTSFSFGATQGGANPAPQTLNISNTGGGTLNWHARTNASWFSLSQIDGSGNASIRVSVTTAGLLAGTYNGSITIGADGVSSFVTVPVTLTITQ